MVATGVLHAPMHGAASCNNDVMVSLVRLDWNTRRHQTEVVDRIGRRIPVDGYGICRGLESEKLDS